MSVISVTACCDNLCCQYQNKY